MRSGFAVPSDLGDGRSACDAGGDGRVGQQQAHGAAGRLRKAFCVAESAARTSGFDSERGMAGCAGSWPI